MKVLYPSFLFRLACFFLTLAGSVHAERILFIGNSYTSVNKLPEIYQESEAVQPGRASSSGSSARIGQSHSLGR